MQRKLIDDLVELEFHTEKISQSTTKCRQLLEGLLSAQDKSFEVILCGEVFDFDVPFTDLERIELSTKCRQLIDKLMIHAFTTNNWDIVTVFASGTDPIDLQCEIIKSQDLYNVTDSNGCAITALPLNEDAHVVKVQRIQDEEGVVTWFKEVFLKKDEDGPIE